MLRNSYLPDELVTPSFTNDESFDFFNDTVAPDNVLPGSSLTIPVTFCACTADKVVIKTVSSVTKNSFVRDGSKIDPEDGEV